QDREAWADEIGRHVETLRLARRAFESNRHPERDEILRRLAKGVLHRSRKDGPQQIVLATQQDKDYSHAVYLTVSTTAEGQVSLRVDDAQRSAQPGAIEVTLPPDLVAVPLEALLQASHRADKTVDPSIKNLLRRYTEAFTKRLPDRHIKTVAQDYDALLTTANCTIGNHNAALEARGHMLPQLEGFFEFEKVWADSQI
ncbi:MAG: hypothetical protein AAFX94_00220, partial [Myxococcota bacterium]